MTSCYTDALRTQQRSKYLASIIQRNIFYYIVNIIIHVSQFSVVKKYMLNFCSIMNQVSDNL